MIDIKVKGTTATRERLDKVAETTPEAAMIGVTALGEYIMSYAVELVPVNTGRLRQSGYVAPPATTNDPLTVQIGFGTNYAVSVHEKTEVPHQHGEAKFLEKAVLKRGPGSLHKVATWAEKALLRSGEPSTKFPTSGGTT